MLHSMTGYGKATATINNKKIKVEIKSLNSKNLDLHIKMPSLYKEKELDLRSYLLGKLTRGKVELSIFIEEGPAAEGRLEINKAALTSYFNQISELAKELGDQPTAYIPQLLSLPDAFKSKQNDLDENEWKEVFTAVEEACNHLQEFRIQEGDSLAKDFEIRIKSIRDNAKAVQLRLPIRRAAVEQKIKDALAKMEGDLVDQNRFEQELIYYLEKLDVSEEEVRLENHLNYFLATMKEEAQNGRKLGFISQEIGREINTMGSKANDAEIQKHVVLMKDDLEKIKEQILNVL